MHGDRPAFAVAGILMAIFAIPFALFVRERAGARVKFTAELGLREFRHAARTVAGLPSRPVLLLFLAGNLLAVDSLNSMIQWAAQFFRDPAAFAAPEREVTSLLIGLSLSGTIAGFVAGRACDSVGPTRVLLSAVLALAVVSTVDSVTSDRRLAVWLTVIGGGYGAAGVWLAGRRMLVDLAPPDRLAEHMGLLGVTRKASIFGTVVLATLADARDWRYAILALVVPLLSGAVLTEQIFTVPGFGKLVVDAVFSRDYFVIQGVVLVTATVYITLNLLADIAYVLVNPRLRS